MHRTPSEANGGPQMGVAFLATYTVRDYKDRETTCFFLKKKTGLETKERTCAVRGKAKMQEQNIKERNSRTRPLRED
jgi:hypothetical protein